MNRKSFIRTACGSAALLATTGASLLIPGTTEASPVESSPELLWYLTLKHSRQKVDLPFGDEWMPTSEFKFRSLVVNDKLKSLCDMSDTREARTLINDYIKSVNPKIEGEQFARFYIPEPPIRQPTFPINKQLLEYHRITVQHI